MSKNRFEKLIADESRKLSEQAMSLAPQPDSLLMLMKISGKAQGLKDALEFYRQAHRHDEDE